MKMPRMPRVEPQETYQWGGYTKAPEADGAVWRKPIPVNGTLGEISLTLDAKPGRCWAEIEIQRDGASVKFQSPDLKEGRNSETVNLEVKTSDRVTLRVVTAEGEQAPEGIWVEVGCRGRK